MSEDSAESSAGAPRVGADENLCHECGWNETPARKNYRKCPRCGAPFLCRYEQRLFSRRNNGE